MAPRYLGSISRLRVLVSQSWRAYRICICSLHSARDEDLFRGIGNVSTSAGFSDSLQHNCVEHTSPLEISKAIRRAVRAEPTRVFLTDSSTHLAVGRRLDTCADSLSASTRCYCLAAHHIFISGVGTERVRPAAPHTIWRP